jgi:hypothetical protein
MRQIQIGKANATVATIVNMLEKAELRPSSGKWIIFIVAIGSND